MRDESAIIESIHYLLKKLGRTDKLKIVKLLFFADKYHILKYARQISGDNYQALPQGPIPSGALDVLNFVSDYGISVDTIQRSKELFKVNDYNRSLIDPDAEMEYDSLSKTDIEALNFVLVKCKDINIVELLSNEDRMGEKFINDLPEETINIAKEVLTGHC